MKKSIFISLFILLLSFSASCIEAGSIAETTSFYTDKNGDKAPVPKDFYVSTKANEQTISTGLVIIGSDGSEFVWVPMKESDFSNDAFSQRGFYDETNLSTFIEMKESVLKYGGFYIGRYETVKGKGNIPQSKKSAKAGDIWVHIPPQDMIKVCKNLYSENKSVTVFLPWGINWDRTLQWLVDTKSKSVKDVSRDSSSWGNYANNNFGSRNYSGSGAYEETKANNIYDLAGNFWEWTQERTSGGSYAARSGGYGIMGGPCNGNYYPASVRSGLPGNDHHPNIGFRIAMWVK